MPKLGERYSRALITGASSGLGKAFSEGLIKEGLSVWGTSREPEQMQSSDQFTPIKLDLTKEREFKEWFDHWDSESGGFDVVINNAGASCFGRWETMSAADVEEQIRVLLTGPMQLGRVAYRALIGRGQGSLVNISSVAGEMPIPYMTAYNASKAGLSAFSQSLMLESPKRPPWIIDFRPGDYQTSFNKRMKKRLENDSECESVWNELEKLMANAPETSAAVSDLISALGKFRHCTRYSGSFVQTSIASMASRLLPNALKRYTLRSYYKIS
ncbi:MAG: SDR family NAD(P)-dependent oxidoreductase [Opitutales bacterium]|jgi:uncharacterized protein|nr:SDR family NAD(P)-dependent oxidoreductase [Opitutales bacterium]MDG2166373.1 SDR family NAD(P)-dependent oxidoreductase [Opitutales bacterium]